MPTRVLLIEDNKSAIGLVTDLLQDKGCEVVLSENQQLAQSFFAGSSGNRFQAVIMDAFVPQYRGQQLRGVEDGFTGDLVRLLRRLGFTGPMIAFTNSQVARSNMSALGCSHECPKAEPGRILEILATLGLLPRQ